jgi:hypothetical protein
MPTAMHWYNEIAKKFGVDHKNEQAVEDFFVHTVPMMNKKDRESITRFLLGHDGPAKVPPDCDCSSCEKTRARGR